MAPDSHHPDASVEPPSSPQPGATNSQPEYPPQLFLSSLPEGYPPPLILTETRLPSIDPVSLSLHKALHIFKAIRPDYADVEYDTGFNWSELKLPVDEERDWYCVVFRSKRKVGSELVSLYEADKLAHDEAIRNGGLLLYRYGSPNPKTRANLSTCIWQSPEQAKASRSGPDHTKAMGLAKIVYESYHVENYVLRKVKGQEGVSIIAFEQDKVGSGYYRFE